MTSNRLTVKFIGQQSAEDLYRCKETGKVYVRQPCDDVCVRWLTTSKWRGGYEADCHIREGMEMAIVDGAGNVLYVEPVSTVDGYCWTVAPKMAPFSYEAIRKMEFDIRAELGLQTYDSWKAFAMEGKEESGYTDYWENWLYWEVEYEKSQRLKMLSYLGQTAWLTSRQATHKITGKTWTCYEIVDKSGLDCLGICGYQFDRDEEK